jgi:hypothetical protein
MDREFFLKLFAVVFVALAALFAPLPASAQLAIFSTETMAKLHCPTDEVVWLDFAKRRYYTRGQKLYERGRDATYACRKEAKRSGYKKSRFGRR